MSFIWPKEGVAVLLLPAGALGEQVFDLAIEWTGHRLLSPALYVKLDEQKAESLEPFEAGGPTDLVAHVVGRNGSREVSLMEELTRNDIDLLRVVACRIVEDASSYHEHQDKFVDRLRTQIQLSVPRLEQDGASKVGTRLLLINLIAGPTMRTGGSTQHLLEAEWDANVILSPEDRPTPTGFDSFTVEGRERFAGFLLSNLATTAGLWTGVNRSLIEFSDIETSTTFDKVLVQRTFARVVKTDGLAAKMAASGLRWVETNGNPANDPTFVIRNKERLEEKEFNEAIAQVLKETLDADGRALRFNIESRQGGNQKVKVTFMDALRMFLRFFWERIKTLPRNILETVISKVNRKSTEVFFGSDGDYEVDVHRDLDLIGLKLFDCDYLVKIEQVKKLVQGHLEELHLKTSYRSEHPNLWRAQRKVVMDILDGTFEPFAGKVLADPEQLIPRMGDTWQVPSFVLDPDEDPEELKSSLDWLDADFALKLSDQLSGELAILAAEARELGLELIAAETEKESAKKIVRQIRNVNQQTAGRERSLRLIMDGVSDVDI